MLKYKYFIIIILSFIALGNTYIQKKVGKSAGAPIGTTGAPGENSCAMSGCHNQRGENTGQGNMAIDFNNGQNTYYSSNKYTIKISINDNDSLTKFGFQLVALYKKDTVNAGKFSLLEPFRTQLLIPDSFSGFFGKEYVTHTLEGTEKKANGYTYWEVDWTSPSEDLDTVVFYVAGNASNNNGEMYGDYIYTGSLQIRPGAPASILTYPLAPHKIICYPSPASDRIFLNYEHPVQVMIMSLNGEVIFSSKNVFQSLNIPSEIPNGTYLFKIQTHEKIEAFKMSIIR